MFAERAYKARVVCEGEDSPVTKKMKKLMHNPASHANFGACSMRWKSKRTGMPTGLDTSDYERWLWKENLRFLTCARQRMLYRASSDGLEAIVYDRCRTLPYSAFLAEVASVAHVSTCNEVIVNCCIRADRSPTQGFKKAVSAIVRDHLSKVRTICNSAVSLIVGRLLLVPFNALVHTA